MKTNIAILAVLLVLGSFLIYKCDLDYKLGYEAGTNDSHAYLRYSFGLQDAKIAELEKCCGKTVPK